MPTISRRTVEAIGKVSRLIKHIPGAVLLLDIVRRHFISFRTPVQRTDFDRTLTLRLDLTEHMQSQIFWFGFYSRDIVKVLDRFLRPGMCFIDVGANIGEITLCASQRVGQNGRVYSFEPMPGIYSELVHNVTSNQISNVITVPIGLSDRTGQATIYDATSDFRDGSVHRGLATLYPMAARNTPILSVPLTTIDLFVTERHLTSVDLIKIDVEGSELDVLRGAIDTIRAFHPSFILEVQSETSISGGFAPSQVLDFLEALGYKFFIIGRHGKLKPIVNGALRSFQNVFAVVPTP